VKQHTPIVHYGLQFIAYLLIILGLLGLLLPIVPGWIFVILGVLILGEESFIGGHIYRRLPKRVQDYLQRTRQRLSERFGSRQK
jgi:hypothetical protein